MSRAFLKDDDGWRFCRKMQTECLFVDDDGSCMSRTCRQFPERDGAVKQQSGKKQTGETGNGE